MRSFTVGREVVLYYDSSDRLTAITAAGLGGNSVFEVARFHYKTLTLNPGFPGLTIRVPNNNYNIEVMDAVNYPSSGSGYWFGDADSYSSYGMLAKVVEQRSMIFSSTSLNFPTPRRYDLRRSFCRPELIRTVFIRMPT